MGTTTKGMVLVPGSEFLFGSTAFYPEEAPVRPAEVGPRWVDETPVTNAAFRRFVKDTGYLTVAEREPDPADFPGADPADLVPGSQVFTGTHGPVPLDDWTQWWDWVPGANWRHPEGPDSTLHGRDLHPVVHIGYEDALAYAAWIGKELPTEEEWEHAARGGLNQATYPWGDEFMPHGKVMANTWHGRFPFENTSPHGFVRTSPVRSFRANGYGLFDVAGNVWEWTDSPWTDDHSAPSAPGNPSETNPGASCCAPQPQVLAETDRRVTKGGSHLCAPSYCHRYRPAARQGHTVRSTTGHLGFRCIIRA
jgi:formylglycine-generating enzyme required for sulfatase activity